MRSEQERETHQRFVRALQHEHLTCPNPGCGGAIHSRDLSQQTDKIKTYETACERCGQKERIAGNEQAMPPWDNASLELMADEHLMHQQPVCPFDDTPVVFISLPNPRRRARYRLCCFYCGRQTEMDWPPAESKR
ncbi:MAG: hypothetical protein CK534_06585 [Nitrospirae bacterium]|nr:MAG: hypothetical protein CK534_06585 [Nitrospirota bacterium]